MEARGKGTSNRNSCGDGCGDGCSVGMGDSGSNSCSKGGMTTVLVAAMAVVRGDNIKGKGRGECADTG